MEMSLAHQIHTRLFNYVHRHQAHLECARRTIQWHYLLILPSLNRVEVVDTATIPLAFGLRAARHCQIVKQVG